MKYNFQVKIMVISPVEIMIAIFYICFSFRGHQFLPATITIVSPERRVLIRRLFWSNSLGFWGAETWSLRRNL